jgi:hypothetical protein
MNERILYRFRVRDQIRKKWYVTHFMTVAEAIERYGEGNSELVEGSREVRSGDPSRQCASHIMSSPTADRKGE